MKKPHVLESLFNKIAGLEACNFIKNSSKQVFFCKICEIVSNTEFEKHHRTTASVIISCFFTEKLEFDLCTCKIEMRFSFQVTYQISEKKRSEKI